VHDLAVCCTAASKMFCTALSSLVIWDVCLGKKSMIRFLFKGPRKAVLGYKITPTRFKTTYRSVLAFEEKEQSITHLFKTFSVLGLGCNAFILSKRSENTVK